MLIQLHPRNHLPDITKFRQTLRGSFQTPEQTFRASPSPNQTLKPLVHPLPHRYLIQSGTHPIFPIPTRRLPTVRSCTFHIALPIRFWFRLLEARSHELGIPSVECSAQV